MSEVWSPVLTGMDTAVAVAAWSAAVGSGECWAASSAAARPVLLSVLGYEQPAEARGDLELAVGAGSFARHLDGLVPLPLSLLAMAAWAMPCALPGRFISLAARGSVAATMRPE